MSTTARSARPIRRWISCVRPVCLPRDASRAERVWVARGSMPYSAVTQPCPLPRRKLGTPPSTLAVHSTRVSPKLDQHGTLRVAGKGAVKAQRTQFVGRPPARSRAHAASQRSAAAVVLSLCGAPICTA